MTIKIDPVIKPVDGHIFYGFSATVEDKILAETLKNLFKQVVDTVLRQDGEPQQEPRLGSYIKQKTN